MMTTLEVGKRLVELCRQGKNLHAVETLYSPDIVSVEPAGGPDMPAEMKGTKAVLGKNQWWFDAHEVHAASCDGPYPHGDRFAVKFQFDATVKETKKRFKMDEVGLYTVKDGKIVREEFFYDMA